jgi:transcriptional regulator with XRE-family HTH domain
VSIPTIDLDLLASHLKAEMAAREVSLRSAAGEIGCSPATLSRLLKGRAAGNSPDANNLFRSVSWLGRSIADFELGERTHTSSVADVEVHLRALPGLSHDQAEALIAMVKAAHDAALQLRQSGRQKG